MDRKKVSVLLPNYNNGPYLKEALDSLFRQSYQNFVIFFVDDCSTDDSLEIARSYKDERLKIIEKDKNSGIVDTLNKGLALIDTPYFIRMDGDDISTPDRFEKLIHFMELNPEIGVCSSDIQTFGKDDVLFEYERNVEMNKANLIFGHSLGHASSIFRTAVFKEFGITYRDLFWRLEDYDLFYQLKDFTSLVSIPGAYYLYRRDTYNDNPEIATRKNEEFRAFYKVVLTDLGLKPTDEHIAKHLQLNNRETPSFSIRDYTNYLAEIEKANQQTKIYPKEALNEVCAKFLHKMVYRLIGFRKISFWEVLRLTKTHPGALKFFIRNWFHNLKTKRN